MSHHEACLFSKKRSEDLKSYWEFDAGIIARGCISDRDGKSWDSCEWSWNSEDIFEVECKWIIPFFTYLPCNSWCGRCHNDIDFFICFAEIIPDELTNWRGFLVIRIIESAGEYEWSYHRTTLDLCPESGFAVRRDIMGSRGDETIADTIIAGHIGSDFCWADDVVDRDSIRCMWKWDIHDLSAKLSEFLDSNLDLPFHSSVYTIDEILLGYSYLHTLQVFLLPDLLINLDRFLKWCCIMRIMSSRDLVELSSITDLLGKISWGIQRWCHCYHSISGIASICGLESYYSAHAGWLPDTPSSICAKCCRRKSGCNCNGWSRRRSTWDTRRIPWILGRTECAILAASTHRVFIHICLTKWHISSFFHPIRHCRFIRRDKILKHLGACGCTDSFFTKQILYRDRKRVLSSFEILDRKSSESVQFSIEFLGTIEEVIINLNIGCFSSFYEIGKLKERKVFEVHNEWMREKFERSIEKKSEKTILTIHIILYNTYMSWNTVCHLSQPILGTTCPQWAHFEARKLRQNEGGIICSKSNCPFIQSDIGERARAVLVWKPGESRKIIVLKS